MANALALLATQLIIIPRLSLSGRAFMLWGAALLAVGVAVQVVAGNLELLLASQVIQGLGAGLARPGFTGGASVAIEPHEQGAAAGLVVAANGSGFVFSPIIGGVVYEHFGMDWPLYITLLLLGAMWLFVFVSRRLRTAPIAAQVDEGAL